MLPGRSVIMTGRWLVVLAHVVEVEALGHGEVELARGALPVRPSRPRCGSRSWDRKRPVARIESIGNPERSSAAARAFSASPT